MSRVVKHLKHDGAVELSRSIFTELQLDQTFRIEGLASAGIHFVLFDERQNIQKIKYMTLNSKTTFSTHLKYRTLHDYTHLIVTVGIREGLKTEGAVIKRQSFKVYLVRVGGSPRLFAPEEIFPLLSCQIQLV